MSEGHHVRYVKWEDRRDTRGLGLRGFLGLELVGMEMGIRKDLAHALPLNAVRSTKYTTGGICQLLTAYC